MERARHRKRNEGDKNITSRGKRRVRERDGEEGRVAGRVAGRVVGR